MGSMSMVHWAAVLLVVILVFGTKKLGTIGSDLGKAVKGFKDGAKGGEENSRAEASIPGQLTDNAGFDIDIKEKVKSHAS
jgi:sec-independent protein translocase protein TatA